MQLRLIVPLFLLIFMPAMGICSQQYTAGPFIFNVRSQGENFYENDRYVTVARNFSSQEIQSVLGAANYWAERIGGNYAPAIIVNLAKVPYTPDGTAYSYTPDTGRVNPDLYLYLVNGTYFPPNPLNTYNTSIGFIADYTPNTTRLLMDDNSITSTISHELMHALGMIGSIVPTNQNAATWQATNWNIDMSFGQAWASRLYDINGNRATQDMLAFNSATPTNRSGGDFVLPQFNADPTTFASGQISFFPTFHGPAVDALTNGKGMPVMAGNGDDYKIDGGNVLGHPALLGSIMSYSPLRNMLFSELELATLKDMGYAIDLSQFFGKSYYPTNLGGMLTQDPIFPLGKAAYLAETPLSVTNANGFNSSASYGVGLHVYRDWLTVIQAADISASGFGAGGIRIDGTNNTVTIPGGTTVAANGSYGTGLLASYGKHNVINLQGTVEATGQMGIGAHFGIGMANSYFNYSDPDTLTNSDNRYFYTKMNSDLNGPLVSAFNVSGTLRGSQAAIKIDNDAHVAAINVRSSAAIYGDIVSEWNPTKYSRVGTQYLTDLNFGGSSTPGDTDSNFFMRYYGNIVAPNGMRLYVRGGALSLNGTANVTTASVDAGATLMGNSTISVTLNTTPVTNAGTIAPGNGIGAINILGNFLNSGNLLMEFNAWGGYDQLNVSGMFTNSGTVTITPVRDYYSGTTSIPLFSSSSGSLPTVADTFLLSSSPTLQMSMSGGPTYTVTTIRTPNAYSKYGTSSNSVRVGSVLSTIGDIAVGDTQTLFDALDFSARDGSEVALALGQLSPQAYNSAMQASLDAERMLSATLLHGMMSRSGRTQQDAPTANGDAKSGERSVFVEMYGSTQSQQARGSAIGFSSTDSGLLGGFEHRFDETGLTAGLHAALGQRQAEIRIGSDAQSVTEYLHIGSHALLRPDAWGGVFLYGQGRLGVENNKMSRAIGLSDYQRTSRSDWIGFAGAANVGAGYERRLGAVALGPIVGLDYTSLAHPQINEYDGGGTRLTLDAASYNSLRSGLGAQARLERPLSERLLFQTDVSAQWMHELLDPTQTVRAAFTGYEARKFDTKLTSAVDSLSLQGNMALVFNSNFKFSLNAGTELFRPGYESLHGGLSAIWRF